MVLLFPGAGDEQIPSPSTHNSWSRANLSQRVQAELTGSSTGTSTRPLLRSASLGKPRAQNICKSFKRQGRAWTPCTPVSPPPGTHTCCVAQGTQTLPSLQLHSTPGLYQGGTETTGQNPPRVRGDTQICKGAPAPRARSGSEAGGSFMKPLDSFSTEGVVAGASRRQRSCVEDDQPLMFSRTQSNGGINPWMFSPTCVLVSTACPAGEALIACNWAVSRWSLNGGCLGRGMGLEHSLPHETRGD